MVNKQYDNGFDSLGYRNCHKGPVMLLEHRGLELYGASKVEAESSFYDFDLVISLDYIDIKHPKSNLSSIGLQRLVGRENFTEHMILNWPDMGIPRLSKEFWNDLAYNLRKKGRDRDRSGNKYKVMVHCIGGHGRTGTALCILACLCTDEGWQGENLLTKVRKLYCHKASETFKQVEYIEYITGVKLIGVEGSKDIHIGHPTNHKSIYPYEESCKRRIVDNFHITTSTNRKVGAMIPITEEEKTKRNIEKDLQVKYFNKSTCIKHNQVACRNCKDERNRERDRLMELERIEREKALNSRLADFMKNDAMEDIEIVEDNVISEEELKKEVRRLLGND